MSEEHPGRWLAKVQDGEMISRDTLPLKLAHARDYILQLERDAEEAGRTILRMTEERGQLERERDEALGESKGWRIACEVERGVGNKLRKKFDKLRKQLDEAEESVDFWHRIADERAAEIVRLEEQKK